MALMGSAEVSEIVENIVVPETSICLSPQKDRRAERELIMERKRKIDKIVANRLKYAGIIEERKAEKLSSRNH